jgi:hypothetical protein
VEYHSFTTKDELLRTLASGETYDVVVPSHFMLKQLLAEHQLSKLEKKFPGTFAFAANVTDAYQLHRTLDSIQDKAGRADVPVDIAVDGTFGSFQQIAPCFLEAIFGCLL